MLFEARNAGSLKSHVKDLTTLNYLSNFIDQLGELSQPPLPLIHTTNAYDFREIIKDGLKLRTREDAVLGEPAVYFFYGKPAYRTASDKYSILLADFPVYLVIDPLSLSRAKHVFPLDSGAFNAGLFDDYFADKTTLEEMKLQFEMDNGQVVCPDTAQKAVHALYGSNEQYFRNSVRSDLRPDSIQFEVESYFNLVNGKERTEFDDRASAIEIISGDEFNLTPDNLWAVILPEPFSVSEAVGNAFLDYSSTEMIPFTTFRSSPSYYAAMAVDQVGELLRRRSLL